MEQEPSANRGSARSLVKRSWESVIRGQFGCFALMFLGALVVLFRTDYRTNPPPPLLPTVGPRVPIPVVSAATLASGRAIFWSESCSNCHALRDPMIPSSVASSIASSIQGPDLTHEGKRNPSIDWQMTNLAQHSRIWTMSYMPDYPMLPGDLRALASYLASRR